MFRGLCTVTFTADDVPAAVAWYADLFGVEPYFRTDVAGEPVYVEFRIGDDLDEIGLLDRRWAPPSEGVGGGVTHWAVDDVRATFADLLARGARVHDPVAVRGEGFVTGSVVDPFGNVLGVMENAHWMSQHVDREDGLS